MSVFPHKFPVVNPTPTVDDCVRAMRPSDFFQFAGATVGSWGYGFMVGRPARFAMAGLMAGIGCTFGSMVILQNTRGRLMGLRENSREVKMYGESDATEEQFKLIWKEF